MASRSRKAEKKGAPQSALVRPPPSTTTQRATTSRTPPATSLGRSSSRPSSSRPSTPSSAPRDLPSSGSQLQTGEAWFLGSLVWIPLIYSHLFHVQIPPLLRLSSSTPSPSSFLPEELYPDPGYVTLASIVHTNPLMTWLRHLPYFNGTILCIQLLLWQFTCSLGTISKKRIRGPTTNYFGAFLVFQTCIALAQVHPFPAFFRILLALFAYVRIQNITISDPKTIPFCGYVVNLILFSLVLVTTDVAFLIPMLVSLLVARSFFSKQKLLVGVSISLLLFGLLVVVAHLFDGAIQQLLYLLLSPWGTGSLRYFSAEVLTLHSLLFLAYIVLLAARMARHLPSVSHE